MKYSQQDVISVRAKLRYSTLIVLPQNEDILDFATGDKDFWIINGAHNLCYVHPAQAGIRSDLHLITASGHVYSFLLTEISNEPSVEPDLKLFVEPKEESSVGGNRLLQGYVRASEAEAYKKELDALHAQTDEQIHAAEARVTEQVNKFKADYQRSSSSTTHWTRKARRNRSSSRRSTTTTPSPTSSAPPARSQPSTKSKTASRTSSTSSLRTASTSSRRSSTRGYLAIGNKKMTFTRRR